MIIDLHCDTFHKMYEEKRDFHAFYENEYHIDIKKMQQGGVLAQCFAVYNSKNNEYSADTMYNKIDYMISVLNEYKEYVLIYKTYEDLINCKKSGKICAVPTIEDLGPVEGEISHIDRLYNLGFKMASITWNHENTLGYSNSEDKNIMSKGLKKFGIEAVERMNELGMIVDVSHLSDGGFYDVAKHSKKPFAASHSNARSLANHTRNLSDEMIKILSDSGGVMGINFYSKFLSETHRKSRLDDIVAHIKHIKNAGGIDCIAIGTDFDGIDDELELYDASKHPMLISELEREKFTQDEIEKISYKNALRLFRDSE
ncbi:MAG: dipeptidase [Eubacteriales bacterium]